MNVLGYVALAFVAGAVVPVLARLNATLAQSIGSVSWAALMLAAVAFLSIACWIVVRGEAFPAAPFGARPWFYFGGTLFAVYILSITFLMPRFGVGPSILTVVTGQIVVASIIDHFGLFGAPVRPIDALRLLGVLLMLAGVALVAWPRSA